GRDRHGAFFAALAMQPQITRLGVKGAQFEGFGNTGASLVKQVEKQVIPNSVGRGLIDRAEDSANLVASHKSEHPLGCAFAGDCEDALACGDKIRCGMRDGKASEAADGGQARVSRIDRVGAMALKVVEEC